MKELTSLIVVVFFTLFLYVGIEPFAHSKLEPPVAPADYDFSDLEKILKKGDIEKGKETFEMACVACHGLKVDGFEAAFDDATASESFGVTVPDLSSTGLIYDANFLADLIINPSHALKLEHKFNDENPHPMSAFYGIDEERGIDQEVADIVAYLRSVAPANISDKEVYVDACLRCHDMKYDNLYNPTDKEALSNYMGMNPPDLSIMIRARSHTYLSTFLNDPQKNLPGTSMPRVGLTKDAQEQVINYMESIGDSKKAERERVGYYMMAFFAILAVLAYLWKAAVWRELH